MIADIHSADTDITAEYALSAAEALCEGRNLRFTKLRRQIFETLWRANSPLSAYDLLERLERILDRRLLPPTVYRALDFLIAVGLVTKIESRNAFVACAHPGEVHVCMFFLCTRCDAATEIVNPAVEGLIADSAGHLGFRMSRTVVELQGLCERCQAAVETH